MDKVFTVYVSPLEQDHMEDQLIDLPMEQDSLSCRTKDRDTAQAI